jgi:hypothetical protein
VQLQQKWEQEDREALDGRAKPVQVPRRTRVRARGEAAPKQSQEPSVLDERLRLRLRSRLWLWSQWLSWWQRRAV